MSLIKLLPENLVNQIAAGEVVERPASVVKELVENSLDAGATKIEIEVNEGGKNLIKVWDNGKGMNEEDLRMAIVPHATSKISEEADLWKIQTMGFRGEALASIASVSKFFMRSKQKGGISGFELCCEGGEIKQMREVAMSEGTQIEVKELFFNTPARQKYLKKDSTELQRISQLMNQIGLANHEVAFTLVHNGKKVFSWAASTDLISRIYDVLGGGVAEAMLPVFYGAQDLKITGFVGKPLLSRSTAQHQYLLVNGRAIQDGLLAHRIKAAYHSMLMEHKKPVFVVNIEIDPAKVDVNVHPRKVEVRFEDHKRMVSVIYGAVKAALESEVLIPKGGTETKRYMSDSFPENFGAAPKMPMSFGGGNMVSSRPSGFASFKAPVMTQEEMGFRESAGITEKPKAICEMIAVAQVNNSYIIAKDSEGLKVIDQHAAHERVRYEELFREFREKEKQSQPLLTPMHLELSNDEILLLKDNLDVFTNLGFEIEEFGGNSFVVRAVPHCLVKEDVDVVVRGVLDDIENCNLPTEIQGKVEEILTYMACRSAIKFGQKLSLDEMQALINQLAKTERPYTCPHGRPSIVALSMVELDRMFGRK